MPTLSTIKFLSDSFPRKDFRFIAKKAIENKKNICRDDR